MYMAGLGRIPVPVVDKVVAAASLGCYGGSSFVRFIRLPCSRDQTRPPGLGGCPCWVHVQGRRGAALARLALEDLSVSGSEIRLRAQVLKQRHQPRQYSDWVIPLQSDVPSSSSGSNVWQLVHQLLSLHWALQAEIYAVFDVANPVTCLS